MQLSSACSAQADGQPAGSGPLNYLKAIVVRTAGEISNKIDWRNDDRIPMWRTAPRFSKETTMKLALIGIGFAAAAAFATPVFAQAVIEDPGYCAQFYPNANCQNLGPGNPYTDGGYQRGWQNGFAMMPNHATRSARPHRHAEPDRYHGGPKQDE
jgi:hypothetical protein